jgi:hypothetical protein
LTRIKFVEKDKKNPLKISGAFNSAEAKIYDYALILGCGRTDGRVVSLLSCRFSFSSIIFLAVSCSPASAKVIAIINFSSFLAKRFIVTSFFSMSYQPSAFSFQFLQ